MVSFFSQSSVTFMVGISQLATNSFVTCTALQQYNSAYMPLKIGMRICHFALLSVAISITNTLASTVDESAALNEGSNFVTRLRVHSDAPIGTDDEERFFGHLGNLFKTKIPAKMPANIPQKVSKLTPNNKPLLKVQESMFHNKPPPKFKEMPSHFRNDAKVALSGQKDDVATKTFETWLNSNSKGQMPFLSDLADKLSLSDAGMAKALANAKSTEQNGDNVIKAYQRQLIRDTVKKKRTKDPVALYLKSRFPDYYQEALDQAKKKPLSRRSNRVTAENLTF